MTSIRLSIFLILFIFLSSNPVSGQQIIITSTGPQLDFNPVSHAVPFLTITPDARSGSLGDAGVATSPDINSQHWNPSKYPFIDCKWGVSISYTPWIRKLTDNINFFYAAGFYHIDNKQGISTSIRYFALGDIVFINAYGNVQGHYDPKEMAFDAAYSRILSEKLSGAITLRYIYSDLTGGAYVSGNRTRSGKAVAADLSLFHNSNFNLFKHNVKHTFGFDLSNMGNKIAYSDSMDKSFLPANLRLGTAFSINIAANSNVCVITDINKLLVPTPPVYSGDTLGKRTILYGKDPNVSVLLGMIRSFWDAPGIIKENGKRSVFLEELHEIMYSFGAEYWYRNKYVLRGGYFYEHESKGNRKYLTTGIGFRINAFNLDIGYIIPVYKKNPYNNTFHFTLSCQIGH
jgi:Type IX secretion system protein PorV